MTDWTPLPGAGEQVEELVLHDLDLVAELTHPTRSLIFHRLRTPHSAAELATQLDVPVTRLYHHLHRLEELGLVRVVATRRSGAKTERRYQRAVRSFRLDPDTIASRSPADVGRAIGALFDVTKSEFQRELDVGGIDHDRMEHLGGLAFLTLSVRPDDQDELVGRLREVMRELAERESADDHPDAIRYRVLIAGFPLSDS